jgi:hypothetical protein
LPLLAYNPPSLRLRCSASLLFSSLLFSPAEELSLGTWVVAGFETWSLRPKTRGDENNEGLLACHRDPDWLSPVQSMAQLVQIRVRLSGSLFLAFSYLIFSLAYSTRLFIYLFIFMAKFHHLVPKKHKVCVTTKYKGICFEKMGQKSP